MEAPGNGYQPSPHLQVIPEMYAKRKLKQHGLWRKIRKELFIEVIDSQKKGHTGLSLGAMVAPGNGYQPSPHLQVIPEMYAKRKLTAKKAAWIMEKNLKLQNKIQKTIADAINDAFANDLWYVD
jgi:hypothetical protein